jgi:hypothetical protein
MQRNPPLARRRIQLARLRQVHRPPNRRMLTRVLACGFRRAPARHPWSRRDPGPHLPPRYQRLPRLHSHQTSITRRKTQEPMRPRTSSPLRKRHRQQQISLRQWRKQRVQPRKMNQPEENQRPTNARPPHWRLHWFRQQYKRLRRSNLIKLKSKTIPGRLRKKNS